MAIQNPASHAASGLIMAMRLDLDQAVKCLLAGGILLYPTETFYAIGCLATRADAIDTVYAIKARPSSSPLPLLAADLEQVQTVVDGADMPAMPSNTPDWQKLAALFWPGPLTLILPARPGLPAAVAPVSQEQGPRLAVRVSANPLARQLARLAACPLVSTSANLSGQAPAQSPDQMAQDFLQSLARHCAGKRPCGIILPSGPESEPGGGMPSTILALQSVPAQPDNDDHLLPGWHLLRQGAISRQELVRLIYE